jgi:hypothetical protein
MSTEHSSAVEISRLVGTFSDMVSQGATVELRSGVVTQSQNPAVGPATWLVSSGGNLVNAIWNNGLTPYNGAPCVLALATVGKTSIYYVMWITDARPSLSGTGTITAFTAGAATCSVKINGTVYTAQRAAGYTPTVGDVAITLEMNGLLYAIMALTVFTPAPIPTAPAVAAPPQQTAASNSLVPCQDSGTWTATYGGWNSYYGQNVYSGSGYVPVSTGSWFYNGGTLGLANKTISAIRFWLPPRRQAGAYNSAATIHLYAHTSVSRGSTEPSRAAGPFDFSVPAGWGGDWITLPLSFAATIQAGGGISIAGDPYAGFTGVGENGSSGALSVDWS